MGKVIIDGVDVNECKYLYDDDNLCKIGQTPLYNCDSYCGRFCSATRDCYYKQLQRLKAENEQLKEENKKLNKMTGIFSTRLCEKYSQALQEIRAIAIHEIKELTDSAINGGRYLEILAKINEVIGEE